MFYQLRIKDPGTYPFDCDADYWFSGDDLSDAYDTYEKAVSFAKYLNKAWKRRGFDELYAYVWTKE